MPLELADDIADIMDSGDDQKEKTEAYKTVVEKLFDAGEMSDFVIFVNHMLAENEMPLVIARQVFLMFANQIISLNPSLLQEVATYTLETVGNRVISFETPVSIIREHLANLYESEGNNLDAAKTLAEIPLESGVRVLEANEKIRINVKIANLYLTEKMPTQAESFINKAAGLLREKHDLQWSLEYKAAFTKILDFKQKYIEASRNYYSLSQESYFATRQDEFLQSAVISGILAPAGPQRSRVLTLLYKYERTAMLDKAIFNVLENMYLGRILRGSIVQSFSSHLEDYQQNSNSSNGMTDLDKAVIEHNLLSCATLYDNISTDELGKLLGIEPSLAEQIAAKMVGEERMIASIDQVEGIIQFENDEQLSQWDDHIAEVCSNVDSVYEKLNSKFPEIK